jgi:cytochrome c biogenesis protein
MAKLSTTSPPSPGDLRRSDVLRPVFRLFTSIKFALGIIAFMALAGVAGVLIPQVPPERRDFPQARADWLNEQEEKFGFFFEPMHRLGLFELFSTWWFFTGMAILVVGIAICTSGRWAPTWRNAFRPQRRVPDRYFETARHRQDFDSPPGGLRIKQALLARGYRVEEHEGEGGRYLFADRFAWAQMATFVSHLAIVVLLIGGVTSQIFKVEDFVFVAEGSTRPVFDLDDSRHLQLQVEQAVGRFDSEGQPIDYRSDLTVYRDGEPVAAGVATVNDPLEWGGYRFHQTAFSPDGVALKVQDSDSGRVLYSESVVLGGRQVSPLLEIAREGETVFADNVLIADIVPGADSAGSLVEVPDSETIVYAGLRQAGDEFVLDVVEANPVSAGAGFAASLQPGDEATFAGVTYRFPGVTRIPALIVEGVPGAGGGGAAVQLDRNDDGTAYVALSGLGDQGSALFIEEGQTESFGGLDYTFDGVRDFSGITVRKDPGVAFLWVGIAMLLGGLLVTFYVPRRRLWLKLTPERVYMAGQAGHLVDVEKEMRRLAVDAGAVGVKPEPDEDEQD